MRTAVKDEEVNQTCVVCMTSTRTSQLPCTFCASCGAPLDGERLPSDSAMMAAMQSVIAVISRYHARRVQRLEAGQAYLQQDRDDANRQAVVREAQVEALRRLLRQSAGPECATLVEPCRAPRAVTSSVSTAVANTQRERQAPTAVTRVRPVDADAAVTASTRSSRGGNNATLSLPPPHYFSQSVSPPPNGSLSEVQARHGTALTKLSTYGQQLLDQL